MITPGHQRLAADDGTWSVSRIADAHGNGCNAVSWSAHVPSVSVADATLVAAGGAPVRLVSGGNDSAVKIWRCDNWTGGGDWALEHTLQAHTDWVRDVACAPAVNAHRQLIASCSLDKHVILWTQVDGGVWTPRVLTTGDDVVWHVSWSLDASMLAVASGDNKVGALMRTTTTCRSRCGRRRSTESGSASATATTRRTRRRDCVIGDCRGMLNVSVNIHSFIRR